MATKKVKYTGKLRDPKNVWSKGYIQKGDKGTSVTEIEKFMNWYYGVNIDDGQSVYGATNVKYTKKFQKEKRLVEDGKWGHKTWLKAISATKTVAVADPKPTTTSTPSVVTKPKVQTESHEVKPATPAVNKNVEAFIDFLEKEHKFVKEHAAYFHRNATVRYSWSSTKENVLNKKKVGISCCYPVIWYFRYLGIKNALHGVSGSFKGSINSKILKYVTRKTSGSAIGLTVKQAVDKGLLKKGDILTFKGMTHTATYTGSKYTCYDGGSVAMKLGYGKYGIRLDYSTCYYKDKKISEILRWK